MILDIIKETLKSLELIVSNFQVINDSERKNRVIELSLSISDIYTNMKVQQSTLSFYNLFMDAIDKFNKVDELLNVADIEEQITSTSDRRIEEVINSFVITRDLIEKCREVFSDKKVRADIASLKWENIVSSKIPINKLAPILAKMNMPPQATAYFKNESVKESVMSLASPLPLLFSCNLYGLADATVGPIAKLNINAARFVLHIEVSSIYEYKTLEASNIGNGSLGDHSLSLQTIKAVKSNTTPRATLYDRGSKIDLLKKRVNVSSLSCEITPSNYVAYIDNGTVRSLKLSVEKFMHIISGISATWYINHLINDDIMKHVRPPREFELSRVASPIAVIRARALNVAKNSTNGDYSTAIHNVFYEEFVEQTSKLQPVIFHESVISFRSKMIGFVKKFEKEFNAEMRPDANKAEVAAKALESAINERDNPFDIIYEKNKMFLI